MSPRSPRRTTSGRRRFPARELARFLLLPAALTLLVIIVFMQPWRNAPPARENGYEQVRLIQKGRLSSVTSLFGGPSGSVWYTPNGASLSLRVRAKNMEPGRRYILEIQVDSTIYDIASLAAGDDGRIALDSSLTSFAEGICVGDEYDPPLQMQKGRIYTVHFWLKRDGNPRTGSQHPPSPTARALPCHGNGDGNYRYVLLENNVARYRP